MFHKDSRGRLSLHSVNAFVEFPFLFGCNPNGNRHCGIPVLTCGRVVDHGDLAVGRPDLIRLLGIKGNLGRYQLCISAVVNDSYGSGNILAGLAVAREHDRTALESEMTDGLCIGVGIDIRGVDDLRAHIELDGDFIAALPCTFNDTVGAGCSFDRFTVDGNRCFLAPCGDAQRKCKCIVRIGADLDLCDIADRIVVIADGRVRTEGDAKDVLPSLLENEKSCHCPLGKNAKETY